MYAFDITDIIGMAYPEIALKKDYGMLLKQQDLQLMKSLKKKVIYLNYTVKHYIQYQ